MNVALELTRKNKRALLFLSVSSLISGGLNAGFLAIITLGLTSNSFSAVNMACIFIIICIVILSIRHVHRYLVTTIANKITNDLRVMLTKIIQSCSARKQEEKGHSNLLTNLTVDIATISGSILTIPLLLSHISFLIGATIYLIYISDVYVFLALVAVVVCTLKVYLMIMKQAEVLFIEVREQHSKIMSYYHHLVWGYKELKMNSKMGAALISNYIKPTNQNMAQATLKQAMKHSHGMNFGQAIIYMLIGAVIFLLPQFAEYNQGVIIGYVITILAASGPVEALLDFYPMFARAKTSLTKIEELTNRLDSDELVGSANSGKLDHKDFRTLSLEKALFSYDDNNLSDIGPIDLTIKSGETVIFVGGNGSGKTTLVKLICGLYMPDEGLLKYNNIPITNKNVSVYRNKISCIFSDFHILKNTPNIYDIASLESNSFISKFDLDDELDFKNENVLRTGLSQGQKRRLAILLATCNLENYPIFLFDEPGSDLDADFKKVFYEEILVMLKGMQKTVLIVSHDDNYYHVADRIIKLREGEIISDTSSYKTIQNNLTE